ncbi:LOW QUALITY PROTEIN: eukaryotic translation initiation factor 3 subunit C-like [Liolophura sinensis]|uniref:LOW QUALITY PROTEIN: eukaryotic translation initiation factor 3 subunit C-like n=1 Tax=Liolophura sinensis TaxID=3198878 RepID=UPI003157F2D0
MSRFFKGSDSESESSESEPENIVQQRPTAVSKAFQFSDDEEETKRIVRSAKDKRYEELRETIKLLKNHKKIKDMSKVLTDFEQLGKAYEKARKVVEKEGVPRFYIRCLVELDDFVSECWEDREGRKNMSKSNAKGLTTLRQKLRKYVRDFETEMTEYKENPDEGDEEAEDEEGDEDVSESDDEEDDEEKDFLKKDDQLRSKFLKDDDMSSDDDDDGMASWTSGDEDDSSSSDDEAYDPSNLAAMFLKKTDAGKGDDKKKEKRKKESSRKRRDEDSEDDGEGAWEKVKGGVPQEKPKMFGKDVEINHEAVDKKLHEIVSARGKKGTDRIDQIDLLKELRTVAEANNLGPAISVKIVFNTLAAIFDYNPNIATCMKPEMWESCLDYTDQLMTMLRENPDIVTGTNIVDESESLVESPYRVRGCILTVIERMDEEFIKMLQACDAHSTEYVERLKDEQKVCTLIKTLQTYLENRTTVTTEELCRVYLRRLEHTYYKFDHEAFQLSQTGQKPTGETSLDLVDKLCKYIYAKDGTDRLRTRAILCHIYHHALHDRWFQARDLMLMSHLQDNIQHSDIPLQILYNRTMVQLGLCAFRQGTIRDAHNCLVDIQSGGRAKELLAQGLLLQRQQDRTQEQEKIEKRRQMPYHMHINLELLECVYLVSAMLMEIPYMAAHEFDARRRMISKNFHHVMRMSERQTLTGPPENMREHVVAASKAMKTGNWKQCKNFIINEKMNGKVWDLFVNPDTVRNMITSKIQEESLRTYLFTYSSVYDSLSLNTLADMFELDWAVVHSIISKMIINEELMASLDEPTETVVLHRTEPSRLQSLALQLSDKVGSLVDNNEKIMEMKQGNFYPFQKGGQSDYRNKNQDNDYRNQRNQRNDYRHDRHDRHDRGQGNWNRRNQRDRNRDRNY